MVEAAMPISERLHSELEDKIKLLNEYIADNSETEESAKLIAIRVHQLSLTRILVDIHRRDPFLLVVAHKSLGYIYLLNSYYEQAVFHFTEGLKVNSNIAVGENTRFVENDLNVLLGKTHLESNKLNEAVSLLEKALQLQSGVLGEGEFSNPVIMAELSRAYRKKKNYAKSLEFSFKILDMYKLEGYPMDQGLISVFVDVSDCYYSEEQLEKAILYKKQALSIAGELEVNNEHIAEIAYSLAIWLDKANSTTEAIETIKITEFIYENVYGLSDKRTLKVKRKTCSFLVKTQELEQALQEATQLLDHERTLYGENSMHHAKGLKLLGVLLLTMNRSVEATGYLKKALAVFRKFKSAQKHIKDVKAKLLGATQSSHDQPISTEN